MTRKELLAISGFAWMLATGADPNVANRYGVAPIHEGSLVADAALIAAGADVDGSLLDHSLIMYGSAMGNGNVHDQTKLPIMPAGGASGRVAL
jgi:hypothetical protein